MTRRAAVPATATVVMGLAAVTAVPTLPATAVPLSTGQASSTTVDPPAPAGSSATLPLPAGFQPEGIATGPEPHAYVSSRANGAIHRIDLVTGVGKQLGEAPGTPSLGLATDRRGRLFVAGGTGGDARVVDTATGEVLAHYRLAPAGEAFVNDVVLTPEAAWFTDSRNPVLYRLPLGPGGVPPARDAVVRLPLTGDLVQGAGINANGITRTPDGDGLLVVQSNTGRLFRVDPATGRTRAVDLGGETLLHGDGMLLDGRLLHVVQNRSNALAVLLLDDAGHTAELLARMTDPRFDTPSTVAAFGGRLYLPNARFTTPAEPTTPYEVVVVDRPEL